MIMSDIRVLTGRAEHFMNSCSAPLSCAGCLDAPPKLSLSELSIRYSMSLPILQFLILRETSAFIPFAEEPEINIV